MGLTYQSTGTCALKELIEIDLESANDLIIALAGNPNTGKSTVFNHLTGLNQHTGNWPGKTVANAQGLYTHHDRQHVLVDLPGTYSLYANSLEEQIARDFICFGQPNATVVVTDATCLERNLNLVLQIMEMTDKVVVCVNLLDEAGKKGIHINLPKLSNLLGVPVVGTTARNGKGLNDLKEMVRKVACNELVTNPKRIHYDEILEKAIQEVEPQLSHLVGDKINGKWASLRLIDGDEVLFKSMSNYLKCDFSSDEILDHKLDEARKSLSEANILVNDLRDLIVTSIVCTAEQIGHEVVTAKENTHNHLDRKIDQVLTSRIWGIPMMIGLLGFIFWLTIAGANIPSAFLARGLFWFEPKISEFLISLGSPHWLQDMLVLGLYRTLAWVVSVMLPPMAIFFPLFALLEDLGYLPRVAFNLDYFFKKACAHGKQALTMCMGFGCNAAGVIACRIIDSPRERLIAALTNNFVPCNGRFPTLIALSTIFIAGAAGAFSSVAATLSILVAIVLGVIITLIISKLLSKTILKGLPSSFTLELPPYRKPQIGKVILRSIFDRTLFVLGRSVLVAAPAGLVIWIMANVTVGDTSLLSHCALFLDPFARALGLDGYILMAFILGLPANEIVIPILIMSYMAKGSMLELHSLTEMRQLLIDNGWTTLTAICMMLFSLNHWPCGTTLWTIRKETGSNKWTLISFLVPTFTGVVICFMVAQAGNIIFS